MSKNPTLKLENLKQRYELLEEHALQFIKKADEQEDEIKKMQQ